MDLTELQKGLVFHKVISVSNSCWEIMSSFNVRSWLFLLKDICKEKRSAKMRTDSLGSVSSWTSSAKREEMKKVCFQGREN